MKERYPTGRTTLMVDRARVLVRHAVHDPKTRLALEAATGNSWDIMTEEQKVAGIVKLFEVNEVKCGPVKSRQQMADSARILIVAAKRDPAMRRTVETTIGKGWETLTDEQMVEELVNSAERGRAYADLAVALRVMHRRLQGRG